MMLPGINQLLKNYDINNKYPTVYISVLADNSSQFITQALKGWGHLEGLNFNIYESDYDSIDGEINNPESGFFKFKSDFSWIIISSQKLQWKFYQLPEQERKNFADNVMTNISDYYKAIQNHRPQPVIFNNFLEIFDGIFGNFANKHSASFLFQIRKLNLQLMQLAASHPNFFINDILAAKSNSGINPVDTKLWINSSMSFGLNFIPFLCQGVVSIINAVKGQIKKCLILDLDNTLWGGVIGDDGISGIKLGGMGIGRAFVEFQTWILELKNRGIILAVCSKNEESIAGEVFKNHPDMILKWEDISVFMANWNNKADNIRSIREILNIGFDSMVFLDDNPVERQWVRREYPEILVPDLPKDPAQYVSFLSGLNMFETTAVTTEDKNRSLQYRQEASRVQIKKNFQSESEYLESLQMKAQTSPFNEFNLPRVVQLIQRSNQFNLRTQRYSETQLQKFLNNSNYYTSALKLEDKFGNYGLVGLLIGVIEKDFLFIDSWIMSCRVLKRGVEFFMFEKLIDFARSKKLNKIKGEYLPTTRNAVCRDLYSELGFKPLRGSWEFFLGGKLSRPHFISEEILERNL